MGRDFIDAYASSINWLDDATVEAEVAHALAAGFRQIKVKAGVPVAKAIERARFVRRLAGDGIGLSVDANWAYDLDDALRVGRALADLDYDFFEEPIRPEDRQGYRILREKLPIRLAAGESDFCAAEARGADRRPLDRPRAAGRRPRRRHQRDLAHRRTRASPSASPMRRMSAGPARSASRRACSSPRAAENCRVFECMVYDNPLRQSLLVEPVGEQTMLRDGRLPIPRGPGLGVALDPAALAAYRIA